MQTLWWMAMVVAVVILIETTYLTVMKLRQRSLKVARGSILLDTCSIMDGRIIDVARTGIITAELIIPRSVVRELQLLADKADHDKRVRARRGLDNIRELQRMDSVSVVIINDGLVDAGGVDERLLELAQKYDAAIATTDYNLNKVAKVINVTVINVNELAQMLRAQLLPGETAEIELIQPGANREQAVGYLDDGTMVVVEDAKNQIGQKVKVEIVRSLQTEAGRMMFAKKVHQNHNHSADSNTDNNSKAGRKTKPSRVRNKIINSGGKIKTAPAFHSDRMEKYVDAKEAGGKSSVTKQPHGSGAKRQSSTKNTRAQVSASQSQLATSSSSNRSPIRRSADDAEAEMVRLANGR